MATVSRTSRLHYFGTANQVLLGDRVEYRSAIFRRRFIGTVVCIPEKSGRELALLGKDPEDWYIKLETGVITGWLYSPEDLQPPARVRLISRASGPSEVISNSDVEEMETKEEDGASTLSLLAPPALLLAILLLIAFAWVGCRLGT